MKRPRTISDAFAPPPPCETALAQSPGGGDNNSAKRFAREDLTPDYTGVWTLACECAARGSIYTQAFLCVKPAPVNGVLSDNFVYRR
jgi:hypothetical protein